MLQNSGERFLPAENRGVVRYEHLHRYALCRDLVRDLDVLDVASGEGYGSALLAQTARSVVGVDVASEAVEFARRNYYYANARFVAGDCSALPVADGSIDIVVSFETIEHHDRHDEMLAEFRRVLRPGGMVVISSPNRLIYSDEPGYVNPFHVKELYFDEFVSLLKRHFRHVSMHGQRIAAASFVYPLSDDSDEPVRPYVGTAERIEQRLIPLKAPMYFVAACSDDEDRLLAFRSLFIDAEDDLVRSFDEERRALVQQLRQLSHRLGQLDAVNRIALPMSSLQAETTVRAELDAEHDVVGRLLAKIADLEHVQHRAADCAAAEIDAERALTTALRARLAAARARQETLESEVHVLTQREAQQSSGCRAAEPCGETIELLQAALAASQRALREASTQHADVEHELRLAEHAARTAQQGLQEATSSRAWRFANRLRRAVGREASHDR